MVSVGHELLHATASITGIHQHQLQQHVHANGKTHHHHHVSDHSRFIKDFFTIGEESKRIFTSMVFMTFYYQATVYYNFTIYSKREELYFFYQRAFKSIQFAPQTPPPDFFNWFTFT